MPNANITSKVFLRKVRSIGNKIIKGTRYNNPPYSGTIKKYRRNSLFNSAPNPLINRMTIQTQYKMKSVFKYRFSIFNLKEYMAPNNKKPKPPSCKRVNNFELIKLKS